MSELDLVSIQKIYFEILSRQQFDQDKLDYSVFEQYRSTLENIAKTGNSAISIFDCAKFTHIFYSANYAAFLGFDKDSFSEEDQTLYNERIHPEDYLGLTLNGISLLKLFYEFSADQKRDYKLVNEFRVLNRDQKYIRVLEQHQVLELDDRGNLWLTLSILDLSPNQDLQEGLKSQLFNIKTGEIIPFQKGSDEGLGVVPTLTHRELEILEMVNKGLLSKEISHRLGISLHTVNTHRQRVLRKLDANNSIEAVSFAKRYGLI